MWYIQDGTFSIVLLVIIMCLLVWHCYPYAFVGLAVFSKFALLVGLALLRNLNLLQFCRVFQICSACARKFGKGLLLLCSLELAQCRLLGQVRL